MNITPTSLRAASLIKGVHTMKEYTTPDINIVDLTTDIITASVPDEYGDTPMADFNW